MNAPAPAPAPRPRSVAASWRRGLLAATGLLAAAALAAQTAPKAAKAPRPTGAAGGSEAPPVQFLMPGFAVRALPLELPNLNAVRYRADGKLIALSFAGTVYVLSDTDGDGLEDRATVFYEPERQHLSLNLLLTPPGYRHGNGVFIARKGGLVLEIDTDGDDRADKEVMVATGWENPRRFPGGATDTVGVALDAQQNLWFGLGAANSQNGYLLENGVASYNIRSERGTLLRMPPDLAKREIMATGIRASFGLAFNAAGDLFCTDQEGATWMPNGNPFDELLHLEPGRHYGFPPRHPKHLPDVIDEPSIVDYGPQHQSTCGLVFNDPVNGGPTFGPAWWRTDAFVAGESRGKLYRTKLVKTPSGYVGATQIVACLSWLTIDQCVSPRGELVVSAHGGPPDWGTGANGKGRIFKIARREPAAPAPVFMHASAPGEWRVEFDQPIPAALGDGLAERITVTAGHYVKEGDRFESFRPGYRAVHDQQAAPRARVAVTAARLSTDRRALIIGTGAGPEALPTSIDIDGWKRPAGPGETRQDPVVSVGADHHGVSATWTSADGGETWSGWLPHLDLQVARELTAPSAAHAPLWAALARPGTLLLRTQLDLWSMLRPAVQPGERLDHTPPPEKVSLQFAASGAAAPAIAFPQFAQAPAVETKGATVMFLRHTPKVREWLPVELRVATGPAAGRLHVSWSTAEDPRPRALALGRLFVPWVRPPAPAIAPAAPKELAGGDWQRGRQLFAMCAMCHSRGDDGSRFGPDLSNLQFRDYASVLQDIAEPSVSLNPDHVGYDVRLKGGETFSAVLLEERADSVLFALPGVPPREVPRRELDGMKVSPVSLMPAGLDQALGPQGLKDLLTFLMLPPPADAPKP